MVIEVDLSKEIGLSSTGKAVLLHRLHTAAHPVDHQRGPERPSAPPPRGGLGTMTISNGSLILHHADPFPGPCAICGTVLARPVSWARVTIAVLAFYAALGGAPRARGCWARGAWVTCVLHHHT